MTDSPPWTRYLLYLSELLIGIFGLRQIWVVASAMAVRVPVPFDIEWMEGGTLISAMRVMQGQPIHAAPDFTYIPFIYPPLYAWVVGSLGHVFAFGYPLARSVSVVSFVGACLALVYGARQAGARWSLALGLAAVFAGTWDNAGTFYDLIRVDSLTIGLLGWALVLGLGPRSWQGVASGILLAAAFMAKHNTAAFGFPMLIGIWLMQGRAQALRFALSAALPALVFLGIEEYNTNGHFLQWILGVPAQHGIKLERLITGGQYLEYAYDWLSNNQPKAIKWPWQKGFSLIEPGTQLELWRCLPWVCGLGVVALVALRKSWWEQASRGVWVYWGGVSLVGVVIVSLMRGHIGGFVNVLIPMYWVMSLWPAYQRQTLATHPRLSPPLADAVVGLAVAAQLYSGCVPDTTRWLPTQQDIKAHEAFIEELATLPEPILLPYAPYDLVQANKETSFALIALWDIDYKDGPYHGFVNRLEAAMKEGHWASVVTINDKLEYGLKKYYHRSADLKHRPPDTLVGWEVQLKQVWVPGPTPAAD